MGIMGAGGEVEASPWQIAGCAGLALCDVHLPKQVLETNYATHKFSSMCRWFNK